MMKSMMRLAICVAVLSLVPSGFAQESSTEKILKRFVDECVSIEPGTGTFPKQWTTGHPDVPLALPQKTVTMENDFRISQYEVTQELYEVVMKVNPSRWKGPRNSVEMMSFSDAVLFCERLTIQLRAAGLIAEDEVVRLPTELEWEYCCKAGTSTRYSFGDSATSEDDTGTSATKLNPWAWHTGNAAGNDPPVGALKPNAWQLYDMHGYLWEYVTGDWTDEAARLPQQPPSQCVIRGGSWRDAHPLLTSASRLAIPSHAASDAIGFRCVID